jgi:hypothetical protein
MRLLFTHLSPQPSSLSPRPSTLSPQPSALRRDSAAVHPTPSTLNPKSSTLRMGSAADVAPPLLSSSISGAVTGAIDYSQIKIDAAVLERIRAANAPVKPKVEEDIA